MVSLLNLRVGVAAATVALAGCAALQGTRLEDMTGAEHASAAQRSASRGEAKLAAAHRRSAEQLEQAERAACRGVPGSDIAVGFSGLSIGFVDDVRAVRGEGDPELVGAKLLVALEGRSLEDMGRIVQCRAARGAVRGDDLDPFGLPGTAVRVSPGDAGWATVEVKGTDRTAGQQIVARTRSAARAM